MRKRICMVTTSRLDIDSRIQNEAEALSADFDVTVLMRKYDSQETLKNTPYKVKRISYFKLWPFKLKILSSIFSLSLATFKERPDFYHAHDLDGLLATAWVAYVKRKPLVYDSHELWAENAANSHLKGLGWLMPILEKFLIKFVSAGIGTSQSTVEELQKKYSREFILVRNMPKITAVKKSETNFREIFPGETVIVHAGQVGPSRGIKQMISAFKYLSIDFNLVFLGGRSDFQIENYIRDEGLVERIHFIKEVPPSELISALKTADLGIVMTEGLTKSKFFSLPNKLLQYIASEIPIIASDIPEHRRIIAEEKIGELTEIKPKLIAKKILNIFRSENIERYKKNLKGLAAKKYNWMLESQKLINFYKNFEKFRW